MPLRKLLPPVRDQGDRETCLSIATSDGHHAARGESPALASDFLHYRASLIEGVGINDAVSPGSLMTALLNEGQPAESDCPYSAAKLPAGWRPQQPTGPVWRRQMAFEYTDVWTKISVSLAGARPVVLLLRIDDAFWSPVAGVIEKPSAVARAYHAVLAIAVSASPARVLVRNSWGDEWGQNGYAWLSSAYIAARCDGVLTFEGAA